MSTMATKLGGRVVALCAIGTLAVTIASACTVDVKIGGDELTGSGVRETRTFDLVGFDRVDVSHTFTAVITVEAGGDHLVEVTADDNFFDAVEVEVRDSTLHIGFEDSVNIRSDERPEAIVVVPGLSGVTGSGASALTVVASGTAIHDVELSGASTLTAGGLAGAAMTVEASGASTMTLEGSATSVELGVSGASSADLAGLVIDRARVEVSGASRVEFGTAQAVSGDVSGASTVTLDERTIADLDVSGASTVRRSS